MGSIGFSGILLLILIALVLFGPKKLPELGRAIGQTVREFRKGAQGMMNDDDAATAKPSEVQIAQTTANQASQQPNVSSQPTNRLPE